MFFKFMVIVVLRVLVQEADISYLFFLPTSQQTPGQSLLSFGRKNVLKIVRR